MLAAARPPPRRDLPPELCAAIDRAVAADPDAARRARRPVRRAGRRARPRSSDEGGADRAAPARARGCPALPPAVGRLVAPRGGRRARVGRAGRASRPSPPVARRLGRRRRGRARRAAAARRLAAAAVGLPRCCSRSRPTRGPAPRCSSPRSRSRRRCCCAPTAAPGRCPPPRPRSGCSASPAPTPRSPAARRAGARAPRSARSAPGGSCSPSRCSSARSCSARPPARPPAPSFDGALGIAAGDVIAPGVQLGRAAAGGDLGASPALVLPWLVRGRSLAADVVARARAGRPALAPPRSRSASGSATASRQAAPHGAASPARVVAAALALLLAHAPPRRSPDARRADCRAGLIRRRARTAILVPACDRVARDERAAQPRVEARRPGRGHVLARLQVRGAAGGDRAQAGARDGRAPRAVAEPHLRAERVRRLALAGGPRAVLRLRGRAARASCRATCSSTPAASASRCSRRRRSRSRPTSGCGWASSASRRGSCGPHEDPARGAAPGRGGPHDGLLDRPSGCPSRCASPTRGAAPRGCASAAARSCSARGGATLGRSREADIVLDDANVSRKHAEVRPSGGSWIVRDLGSTNGVKVNGRRVDPPRPQSLKPRRRDRAGHLARDLRAGVEPHRARSRRRRAEVRLPRRPVPVPALDGALGAQGPAPQRRRRRRPGAPDYADATGLHAAGAAARAPAARRSCASAPAPGCAPAPPTTCPTARCSAAATRPTSCSRTRSPPRSHARLVPHGDVIVLEDLGSTNGTYLNDEPLRGPQPLHPGDRIRIGDSAFTFER